MWLAILGRGSCRTVSSRSMKRKLPTSDARNEHARNELLSLGRSSYVSKSGMDKLLRAAERDGLPEHFSRATHYRARKDECTKQTPCGTLTEQKKFQLSNGEEITVGFANPLAMLHEQCTRSIDFSKIVL